MTNGRKSSYLLKSHEVICHFIRLYLVPLPPYLRSIMEFFSQCTITWSLLSCLKSFCSDLKSLTCIGKLCNSCFVSVQVNFCQKLLFLPQLTHNMTTDCSLNYKFNTWKFQAQTGENMLCTKIVLNVRNNFGTQHALPIFELGIFVYWTCNSMNNLLS